MTIVRWTPVARRTTPAIPVSELSDLIGALFGEAAPRRSVASPVAGTTAAAGRIEFAETEGEYTLALETPGFPKESLKVEIEEGIVTLSGRVEGGGEGAANPFRREFTRRVKLPSKVAAEGHRAVAKDGVLTVTLAKPARRSAEPLKIEVA